MQTPFPVPGDAPEVNVTDVALTSISVEWEEMSCNNSGITGYSIRFGLSDSTERKTFLNYHADNRTFSIDRLNIRNNYTVEVAAINRNGTGPYTTVSIITATPTGKYILTNYYVE